MKKYFVSLNNVVLNFEKLRLLNLLYKYIGISFIILKRVLERSIYIYFIFILYAI